MENRTTIVIVEHGAHEELLKLGAVYACLHEVQLQCVENVEVPGAK
jgi:DNA-binding XRE family transcriptional regulator